MGEPGGVGKRRPTLTSLTPSALTQYDRTNRWLSGVTDYDGAGNLKQDTGIRLYGYDHENRLVSSTQPSMPAIAYGYDGDGRRVTKTVGTATTVFVYDAQGNLTAEYPSVAPTETGLRYVATDHLGSTRLVVDAAGAVKNRYDYLPFGDEIQQGQRGSNADYPGANYPSTAVKAVAQEFTGKERDSETALDYFGARYYGGAGGRFTSPDPSGLLAAKPGNPQSWNLYAYAMNSPLINIDPNGLDCVSATDNTGGSSINHDSNSGACGKAGGTWVPGYVDENWVKYNTDNGQYQVGSVDGAGKNATVDYATFKAGAQTDANGSCTSGCGGYGFSSANANWLQGQLVGNSKFGGLDGYIQFLTGRTEALGGGPVMQALAGPLNFSTNHWAGPGGFGPPGGQGDWAASVHDFNFSTNGPIKIGSYFNPTLSPATARALIQSNSQLIRNAGGVQGAKMGLIFGAVNAFQAYANSFK